jgi:hypothetical protein
MHNGMETIKLKSFCCYKCHEVSLCGGCIYRVIKKYLYTWRLQYRKLQVMFKVSPASLQTFIDTPNCVIDERVQYSAVRIPNVFCDGHLQIINILWWPFSDHQYFVMAIFRLSIFCDGHLQIINIFVCLLCCNDQVHRDFLITLYTMWQICTLLYGCINVISWICRVYWIISVYCLCLFRCSWRTLYYLIGLTILGMVLIKGAQIRGNRILLVGSRYLCFVNMAFVVFFFVTNLELQIF